MTEHPREVSGLRGGHGLRALYPKSLSSGDTFDVIIVGGGGSGAAAAIEATDHGMDVLVLEKTQTPGGSTQESGGSLRIVEDPDRALDHYMELTQGATPHAVMTAFVAGLVELPTWIASLGGELIESKSTPWVFPTRYPASAFPDAKFAGMLGRRVFMKPSTPGREGGPALWDFLETNLAKRGVSVVTNAQVVRLLTEIDHGVERVNGVSVLVRDQSPLNLKARKGVVLCCGGFNYDNNLKLQYLGAELPALSPPGRNTGDGIRLAQQVGADLWHMTGVAATVGYKVSEFPAAFWCRMPDVGFLMTDQRGNRYMNEMQLENHSAALVMLEQDLRSGSYLRCPSYIFFDDFTRAAGRLAHLKIGANRHFQWSSDNRAEIKKGWFKSANSWQELAQTLDLPARSLADTVERFNHSSLSRTADDFGRSSGQMRPIDKPPFYGVAVYPSLVNTQGGPRRNARAAIVRPDGTEITGLFGAGELGSIWNRLYPGAGNVSECLVYGRIAGRSAASSA
jgi:succinate dehydrogenase/fumarate reductase flavoprotein subunit